MENTTAFVDLVLFPCFSSHVKNRLFLQMFSGILFALWLLSLIIFFYHQFSSCRCSDFASQALPFFDFSSIFFSMLFFFFTPAVVSCLPVPILLSFPQMFGCGALQPGPFLHQKQMTTVEETDSLSSILQSATGKHLKQHFSKDVWAVRRTSEPSHIYIVAQRGMTWKPAIFRCRHQSWNESKRQAKKCKATLYSVKTNSITVTAVCWCVRPETEQRKQNKVKQSMRTDF